jgi:hypothetical protein
VFTRALHLSLSWAISIQSAPSHPISLRSILILSTHLRLGLPNGLFPSGWQPIIRVNYNSCFTYLAVWLIELIHHICNFMRSNRSYRVASQFDIRKQLSSRVYIQKHQISGTQTFQRRRLLCSLFHETCAARRDAMTHEGGV